MKDLTNKREAKKEHIKNKKMKKIVEVVDEEHKEVPSTPEPKPEPKKVEEKPKRKYARKSKSA